MGSDRLYIREARKCEPCWLGVPGPSGERCGRATGFDIAGPLKRAFLCARRGGIALGRVFCQGVVRRLEIKAQIASTITAPTTAPIKPAPSFGPYQPRA